MAQHVQVANSTSSNITSERTTTTKKYYTDLMVYAVLKMAMNKDSKKSYKTLRKIAEETGMSLGGVQSAIKRLEEANDIFKTKEANRNAYQFNEKSEKFEMYDFTFLNNEDLNNLQKSFYIAIQKHLYIDKKTGVGKTTYSNKELSEKTGISEKVIAERKKELEDLGFVTRRLTSDKDGNSCEALEFNLPKFGQYVLCTLEKHEEDIAQLKENYAKSNMEINKLKSLLKLALPNLMDVDDAQIEL